MIQNCYCVLLSLIAPRKSLVGYMGANSNAGTYQVASTLEMWTSAKEIVPGVSSVGTWEIATLFTVFRGF